MVYYNYINAGNIDKWKSIQNFMIFIQVDYCIVFLHFYSFHFKIIVYQ